MLQVVEGQLAGKTVSLAIDLVQIYDPTLGTGAMSAGVDVRPHVFLFSPCVEEGYSTDVFFRLANEIG